MERGSACSTHRFAYFTPHNSSSVYRYEWNSEIWEELAPCLSRESTLVTIERALVAVGGQDGNNKLFTLRQKQWVEEFPPMNTARSCAAVVSYNSISGGHLIFVIGGFLGGTWTATVELFSLRSKRWFGLTNLPQPLSHPSATICNNQIHIIGYDGGGYSCSVQALPSSDTPLTPQCISPWISLPRLPAEGSTIASLCGQLVSIGGLRGLTPVKSIHQLIDGQWTKIISMSSGRGRCLVVSQSPDKVLIVGGYGGGLHGSSLDSIEGYIVV
jgi:hypothetical protein